METVGEYTYTPLKTGEKGDIVYEKIDLPTGTKMKEYSLKMDNGFFVFVNEKQYGIKKSNVFTRVETEKEREQKNTKLLVGKEKYAYNEKIWSYYSSMKEKMDSLYLNLLQNDIRVNNNNPILYLMDTSQILIDSLYTYKYKFKTLNFEKTFTNINNKQKLRDYIFEDISKQLTDLDINKNDFGKHTESILSEVFIDIQTILKEINIIKQNKNYETDEETRKNKKSRQNFKKKQQQEQILLNEVVEHVFNSTPTGFRLPTSNNNTYFLW